MEKREEGVERLMACRVPARSKPTLSKIIRRNDRLACLFVVSNIRNKTLLYLATDTGYKFTNKNVIDPKNNSKNITITSG